MKFRKMSTKALAVFMSLLMIFSVCAPAVSAMIDEADKPELNYVSLGDSMTNGYCFEGYKQDSDDRNVYDLLAGKGVYGEDAYPLQFEKHLSKNYKVNHSKLAVSGMLAENLLFLLGGCEEEIDNGWGGYRDYIGTYTIEELQAHYQEKVSEADLITLCIGNAAFGAYLVNMLTDILGVFGAEYEPGEDVSVEGVVDLIESEDFKELVLDTNKDIQEKVRPILVEAGFEEEADLLLNQIAYTVVSYLVHYGLLLDRIVELNPDVEIVLVGLFNAMGDITLEYEGEILPFGDCMTVVYDVLNAYIAAIPALKQANGETAYANATFYYAAQPEAEYIIDVFGDVCNGVADPRLDRDTVRARTIKAYNDTLAVMAGLFPIDLDMVKSYESGEYDWSGKTEVVTELRKAITNNLGQYGVSFNFEDGCWIYNASGDSIDFSDDPSFEYFGGTEADWKLLSVLVYLAIEKALIQSVDQDIISVDAIKAIMNPEELVSIFGDVDGMINGYFASFSGAPVAEFTAAMTNMVDLYAAYALMGGSEADFLAAVENAKAACSDTKAAGSAEGLLNLLSEFFCQEELAPLCKIFLLFKAGNGMSVHPTPACHDDIAESVIYAYDNKHTSFKETVKNVKILADLFVQYRDEIYEYAYAEAKKQGVIDDINAYIDEALKAIDFAEAWANENKNYFRSDAFASQLAVSAAEARKTAEALRTLINYAEALDETTYNNAIALLEQLENNVAELATLVNIAAKDAAEYADIKTAEAMEQLAKALAILNAKMNELFSMLRKIEAIVVEQLAIAESLFEEFIVVAEKYLAKINAKKEELKAYLDVIIKDFLSNDAFSADYRISADSYYLAIGDNTLYAELLAVKLGLNENQFGASSWNDIDATVIAKADLITIGYSESMISGFAAEQLLGYVKNYIDNDIRNSVRAYATAALDEFFKNLKLNFKEEFVEGIYGDVDEIVNGYMNEIAGNEAFADAKLQQMDWAAIVGKENVSYVEHALASIEASLIMAGIPETYTFKQDVAKLFLDNLDSMDPVFVDVLVSLGMESVIEMFGEYATFTHVIPTMDALMFAVESYLYGYVKFNVEYAQLVYAIGTINPDAQVVLLGNYNALEGLGLNVVIPELILDFGKVLTTDIRDAADDEIGGVFGTLENAADVEKIAAVFDALNARIAEVYAEIKAMQGDVASFDLVQAIQSIEISDTDLEALVGAENVEYAKYLVGIVKYILTEAEMYDAIVEEIPSAEDVLEYVSEVEAEIEDALANLDSAAEEAFRALGMTLSEAQAVLSTLSDYVAALKERTLGVQDYLKSIYNAIADFDLTVFNGATIDLGKVLGDSASVHSLVYAFTMKNVIFVDISDAAIISDTDALVSLIGSYIGEEEAEKLVASLGDKADAANFLVAYLLNNGLFDVVDNEYIADRIYAVLNVVCAHYDLDKDHYCDNTACGVKLSECEDANNDGVCDVCDACVDHRYDNACDTDCNNCGAIRTVADHVYDNACDTDCNVCGATRTPSDHVYDNACDVDCNVCGATRTPSDHVYDNACDVDCNVCGATRTVADHVYDNACDADCNVCGATRTPSDHVYDNACDVDCNVCGATRTVADHVYDNACDVDCNVCGATRTVADHVYDNACDTDCNICGAIRTTDHVYDNACDADCNVCGATRTPADHVFGDWVVTKEATRKADGEEQRICSVCGAAETRVLVFTGLSTGAIVAIVAGSVVLSGGAGFAIYWFIIRKKLMKA